MITKGYLLFLHLLICLNMHLCVKDTHTEGFKSKPSLVLKENSLFLPKEKAVSYLQDRSERVKRDIDEECRETDGCWYEEILEFGVTDVCGWMKRRLCWQQSCAAGFACITTKLNCDNLDYYKVECQDIDECTSNPCQNGGTCSNLVNRFSCSCPEHVHGTLCEFENSKLTLSPFLSTCSCKRTNCTIGSIVGQQKCTKVDILFLIDDSSSISSSGFTYAKSVAAKLVDCLTIGPDDVRVGMMTFGSTVSTIFDVKTLNDKNQIKFKIIGAPFRGEIRTYMHIPLLNALHIMNSNPADRLDIVIVLTDGKSYTNIVHVSNILHSAAYIFAMGIGTDFDTSNLQKIARNPMRDYLVLSNDYIDLHRKVSRLINGLCTGFKFPELLTCKTIIKNSWGENAHYQRNGSSLCLDQMDFYGKIQPEFIFINITIDGANNGSKPKLSYTDFKFGITAGHIELLKRVASGEDIPIGIHSINGSSDYQHFVSKFVYLTNYLKLHNGERLCFKYKAHAGGYIKFETKIYHYGTTAAEKNLCYFYDDQAPLHCSDIGTCTFAPLQLAVDITNTSTRFVSFPGWEDIDFAGRASIFASGISHFEINLCEMEYSNGVLNMKHTCKNPKTFCRSCSFFVIDLPQTYESVLYSVVLEVIDIALNSKQTQLFVFYNSSSQNKMHQNNVWWATSASAKTTLFWENNYMNFSYYWTNTYLCEMCIPWIIHFIVSFICCLI